MSAAAAFRFTELPPVPLVMPAVVNDPICTEIWLDPMLVASLRKMFVGAEMPVDVGLVKVPNSVAVLVASIFRLLALFGSVITRLPLALRYADRPAASVAGLLIALSRAPTVEPVPPALNEKLLPPASRAITSS